VGNGKECINCVSHLVFLWLVVGFHGRRAVGSQSSRSLILRETERKLSSESQKTQIPEKKCPTARRRSPGGRTTAEQMIIIWTAAFLSWLLTRRTWTARSDLSSRRMRRRKTFLTRFTRGAGIITTGAGAAEPEAAGSHQEGWVAGFFFRYRC